MDPEEEVEIINTEEAEVEEASLHGYVNLAEAKRQVHFLHQTIETMEVRIKEGKRRLSSYWKR